MNPPTCTVCGAAFETGRRTSQERVDQAATEAGWILGLPHQRQLCPKHKEGTPWSLK